MRRPAVAPAALTLVSLLVLGCGPASAPTVGDGPGDSSEGAAAAEAVATEVAPACDDVPPLEATLSDGIEPTGTTAEPTDDLPEGHQPGFLDLQHELERWAAEHAPGRFAGVWILPDQRGWAIAFARSDDPSEPSVAELADQVRSEIHSGVAVAEARHTEAELQHAYARMQNETDAALESFGADIVRNRTAVGLLEPSDELLERLSADHGGDVLCFEIERQPTEDDAVPAPFVPTAELSPEASSIDVLLNEVGCTGGQSAEGRITEPEIELTETEVVVTLRVIPPGGAAPCPGNPDTPFTAELSEPLGDRELLDGSRQPSAPPTRDW